MEYFNFVFAQQMLFSKQTSEKTLVFFTEQMILQDERINCTNVQFSKKTNE